jgi:ankyrin repeat protein
VSGDERCAQLHRWQAVEEACAAGELDAFRVALGDPDGFPDCVLDASFIGFADRPLDIAIQYAPVAFIGRLLALGADPSAPAPDGFPPLFQAIDAPRADRHAVLALLLEAGADPELRGLNDGTALHHAVARRDIVAVRRLLGHGADPAARTRIDELSTPLEDAEAAGFTEAADDLRRAAAAQGRALPADEQDPP